MQPFVVVIYGPIGVGKSSVIERLAQIEEPFEAQWRILAVPEPIEAAISSGALQSVGESRSSSGYEMQMLIMAERMSSYWQAQARMRRRGVETRSIVVTDGHLLIDQSLFVAGHVMGGRMTRSEAAYCMSSASLVLGHCPSFVRRPSLYIYLKATPETCLRRSRERGRAEEASLDLDTMLRLVLECDKVTHKFAGENSTQVVTIRTDGETPEAVFQAVYGAISLELSTVVRDCDLPSP